VNQNYAKLWRSRQGRGQSDGICEAVVGADPTNRAPPPRLKNKADIWRHHPSSPHLAHRGATQGPDWNTRLTFFHCPSLLGRRSSSHRILVLAFRHADRLTIADSWPSRACLVDAVAQVVQVDCNSERAKR
jgi:hypothetical protein